MRKSELIEDNARLRKDVKRTSDALVKYRQLRVRAIREAEIEMRQFQQDLLAIFPGLNAVTDGPLPDFRLSAGQSLPEPLDRSAIRSMADRVRQGREAEKADDLLAQVRQSPANDDAGAASE